MTSSDSEMAMGGSPTLNIYKDLYFPDGNIVLNVVEGNRTMHFRVHKSLLSRNSLFFADMFGIPQPPENPSGLVEGCPAIHLTDDSIRDWIIILGALYNVFFNKTQQPVSTIIAMLRLGKKYQFPDLEHDARNRLRQWYPSTLNGFRSREQPSSCPFELNNSSELLQIVDEGVIPDDVLPVLYYDNLYLLNNFDDADKKDKMPLVDEKVKLRLLLGHRRLLAAQHQHTFACVYTLQPRCRTISCKNTTKQAQYLLHDPEPSGNVVVRPFITLKDLTGPKLFCDDCRSVVIAGLEAGAAEVWHLLPWAFGLGSWEELLKEAQDDEGEEESNEATDNQ